MPEKSLGLKFYENDLMVINPAAGRFIVTLPPSRRPAGCNPLQIESNLWQTFSNDF
jgi:hypothetical protein